MTKKKRNIFLFSKSRHSFQCDNERVACVSVSNRLFSIRCMILQLVGFSFGQTPRVSHAPTFFLLQLSFRALLYAVDLEISSNNH